MAVFSTQRSRQLLNKTYELRGLVSSQPTHEVYRACDVRDGSAVLVKRLRPELALQPRELARFVARPRVLERLAHPCLPRVCVDTDDSGVAFVVQELASGRPLADLIGAFPQGVPLPLVASVALPIVEALALAHAEGIAHGALDPAHVLLQGPLHDPTAKLIGLEVGNLEALSQDLSYRAPEVAAAITPEPAADVFACGVLLFHMLSGVLPFQAGKRSAVPLHELAPQAPSAFVQLTAACLREQPEARPAEAGALLNRLRACCDLPPQSGPAPKAERARSNTSVPSPPARAPRTSEPSTRASALSQRAPQSSRASSPAKHAAPSSRASSPTQRPSHSPASASSPAQGAAQAPRASSPAQRRSQASPPASSPAQRGSEPSPRPSLPAQRSEQPADDARRTVVASRRAQARAGEVAPSARPLPAPSQAADDMTSRGSLSAQQAAELLSAKLDARRSASSDPAGSSSQRPSQPTAARTSIKPPSSRPSPKPPVTLTQAQLDALAGLRRGYDEQDDRDRWTAVIWVLLLLLLWLVGAPYYLDAGLTKAHATFGPKLRLMATAFSVATVVGALHPLVARAGRFWPIQRLRGAVMQTTASCFVLVTANVYSAASSVRAAADFGQRALPWTIGFGLLLLALEYLLRGLHQLSQDLRYAMLVFAMALFGLFGTYRAVAHGLEREQQRAAALLAKSKQSIRSGTALSDPAYAQTLQAVGDDPQPPAAEQGLGAQRSGIGADEAQDLQPAQQLERAHKRDAVTIEKLQEKLPAVGAPSAHP